MKRFFLNGIAILFFALTCQAGPPGSGWTMVWADDFNSAANTKSIWEIHNRIDYDKNGRQSYFSSQNVRWAGGELQIDNKVHNPSLPNGAEYTGGWLKSKRNFTYGYFEVECRINWWKQEIWPTFWLWSGKANDIELDVMEFAKWHVFPSQSHHYNGGRTTQNSSTKLDAWNTWAVLWTPDEVTFYINGSPQFSSNRPDLARNKSIPMILSSSPNRDLQPPLNTPSLPMFQVRHVRVWQGGNSGPAPKIVALKCLGNDKYVSSEQGTKPITCNRGAIGGWEKFSWVDAGGGKTALKATSNQKYISSENGNKAMTCNRSNLGAWEAFTAVHHGNQVYSFKANNGKYMTGGWNSMWCNVATVGNNQKFQVTWGLKSAELSESQTSSASFEVYPNPASDVVNVQIEDFVKTEVAIEVYNTIGKQVLSKVIPTNTLHRLDVSKLSKGLYIIKSDNKNTEKLIIE